MDLPPPRAKLFGCIWLPRIAAKARLLRANRLAPAYAARFGAPDGVDGVFLAHFQLTKEELLAAPDTEAELSAWFRGRPGVTPERVEQWNQVAENLGRPGFPLAARFPVGLATTYSHLAHLRPATILEMLELDEGLGGPAP